MNGFSLHAAVRCGAEDRRSLEQLCRTITRPALANERVQCRRPETEGSLFCSGGTQSMQLKNPARKAAASSPRAPRTISTRVECPAGQAIAGARSGG